MPKFTIVRQQDAFVEYATTVEAESPQAAVDQAYTQPHRFEWKHTSTDEFDACRVVAVDDEGKEINSYSRGRF